MGEALAQLLLAGKRRALAQALTHIENGGETAKELSRAIFAHTGNAQVIGITGAPGTGKSTLVNSLTQTIRGDGSEVAILAIDPSSPFTGGAIMGDRVRMRALSGDDGVFIRSMATRGNLGGLASATRDAIRALDAAGFPVILLETVGTGQSEVEVVKLAHTTVVVEAPGLGDDVQAIKAGLLEIADIFVVNKADRPGAAQTAKSLQQMLDLGHPTARPAWVNHHGQAFTLSPTADSSEEGKEFWSPPILRTVATRGEGVEQLWMAINEHHAHQQAHGLLSSWRRARLASELRERAAAAFTQLLWRQLDGGVFDDVLSQLEARAIDPHTAVEYILSACHDPVGADGAIVPVRGG